jgi:citrate synthase
MTLRTRSGRFGWSAASVEWPVETEVGPGLEGVIASATRVSWLDPWSGGLSYRGVPIERLAGALSFEEVTFLLLGGAHPAADRPAADAFALRLRASRALPEEVIALLRDLPAGTHPTLLLRAGVSALGCHELTASDDLAGERQWHELRIVGQVAALVAELAHLRRGLPPVRPPDPEVSLARGLLAALSDRAPGDDEVAALDLLWVLYADHGLDAPSFTSMVVASCRADPYYNVVAGLSALRGPRLGGASERVLAQLLPLRDEPEARAWARDAIARGDRIAGFGHRLYRMDDPRAAVLRREAARLARAQGREERFVVARAVEEEASRLLAPKGIHLNINFYAALLFHLLGADAALAPCIFAVGRMAGLVARVHEALEGGRLYRPLSRYRGAPARQLVERAR